MYMKKSRKKIEKTYDELLHIFATRYAEFLCEFEYIAYKIISSDQEYEFQEFKRELYESFVYDDDEIKKIYNKTKRKVNNYLKTIEK